MSAPGLVRDTQRSQQNRVLIFSRLLQELNKGKINRPNPAGVAPLAEGIK
jgi:hypothetical protein